MGPILESLQQGKGQLAGGQTTAGQATAGFDDGSATGTADSSVAYSSVAFSGGGVAARSGREEEQTWLGWIVNMYAVCLYGLLLPLQVRRVGGGVAVLVLKLSG